MKITYTTEKKFTQQELRDLFLSVNWISGQYPEKLYQSMLHSQTVVTAWDGLRLVGLARVLDDSVILAQVHNVLVDPEYQGQGIGGQLLAEIKEIYKDFFYIDVMPEEYKNVAFYVKNGFAELTEGGCVQIRHLPEK